eukprot:1287708-Rhodomonas_salina.1
MLYVMCPLSSYAYTSHATTFLRLYVTCPPILLRLDVTCPYLPTPMLYVIRPYLPMLYAIFPLPSYAHAVHPYLAMLCRTSHLPTLLRLSRVSHPAYPPRPLLCDVRR